MPRVKERPPRQPTFLEFIPPEMKAAKQWLCWDWSKTDKGDYDKPPKSVLTGYGCDLTDPACFATFEQAAAVNEEHDGLGFSFTEADKFCFIDLDNCLDPVTGEITADARYVVELADSYTEISAGGRGLKIYIIADPPKGHPCHNESAGFEFYSRAKYSCVTGNHFEDASRAIRTLSTGDMQRILDFMFPAPVPDCKPPKDFDVDEVELAQQRALCAISPSYAEGYHDWLKVGMAAHSVSSSQNMLSAWEAWSMASPKYTEGACARKWKSFGTGSRAVTIGTLLHLAKENGFVPPWKMNGQAHASANGHARNKQPPNEIDYDLITAAECLRRDYPLEYLIKGVLAKGEPTLVCAPLKACKTLLAADMAVALVRGGCFLGYFPVPRPVRTMMLWGESGWRGVQTNIRRIGMAAGATEADLENLFVGVKLPKFGSPEHARALDKEIKRTAVEVVIIDCLYLCGVSGDTSKNQFDMGELLKSIGNVFVENDCTLVLLHHTTKHIPVGEPLQLDNSAFAGTAEYAAQWLLVNRIKLFDPGSGHHELWLTIGARAGHGGLYGVTIDEGPFVEGRDRDWNVQVMKPEEMRQADRDGKENAREADRLEKFHGDKVRITRAMAALERLHPEGNSKTAIRDRAGFKGNRFDEALCAALNDGAAVECEFLRSNHKTPQQGYKLKPETTHQ